MSTFSGMSTALTGLMAHRRAMEVASQNIANANTEGYSRQRVNLQAIGGPETPGIYSKSPSVGSGVTVDNVERVRDAFLETRGRVDHAQAEFLNTKQGTLDRVQQAFMEPSDTALQAQLSELWTSFSDLSNLPNQAAARGATLQRAGIVADSIRGAADSLMSVWGSDRESVDTTVAEVNSRAGQVASLNKSIVASKITGQPVNELSDQRDLLVMKLAELTGARGVSRDDGSMDVLLNGSSLVYGGSSRELVVTGAIRMVDRIASPVQLAWADNNGVASASSGKLAATMESLTTTIPGYLAKLDTVATALVSTVNAQHEAGFDLAGNPGKALFSGTSADTVRLAITNPDELAAAGVPDGSLDGSNADKLADLATEDKGPDRRYRQLVVDLGVEAQTVDRRVTIQASVVTNTDAARSGQAGVSLDEEMTNLVTAERAYQAAAKVISTIDEMLDTLINRM